MAVPCGGGRGREGERELQLHFMLSTSVITPQIASCSQYLVSEIMKITFLMIPITMCLCASAET